MSRGWREEERDSGVRERRSEEGWFIYFFCI